MPKVGANLHPSPAHQSFMVCVYPVSSGPDMTMHSRLIRQFSTVQVKLPEAAAPQSTPARRERRGGGAGAVG